MDEVADQHPNLDWVASLAKHIGSNVRNELKKNQPLLDALKNSLDEVQAADKAIKDKLNEKHSAKDNIVVQTKA